MTALVAPHPRKYESAPEYEYYGMTTGVVAYQGGLAVLASGYVRPGYTATGLVVVGIFDFTADVLAETMDNSGGSNGDLVARVRRGVFPFANQANDLVLATDVGSPCYIVDDNTVARTDGTGTRSIAGTVRRVDSDGVWVELSSINGTALAAEVTAREALATDLGSSTGTTLAGKLTGTQAANVADANVIGGIAVTHRIAVADGATGDVDVTLTHKTLVTDVHVIKTAGAGGASDTLTVKNGATAITDAMSINIADKAIVRAGTIDDAQMTISAGGTLRCTRTKASAANVACIVIVRGLRVA